MIYRRNLIIVWGHISFNSIVLAEHLIILYYEEFIIIVVRESVKLPIQLVQTHWT